MCSLNNDYNMFENKFFPFLIIIIFISSLTIWVGITKEKIADQPVLVYVHHNPVLLHGLSMQNIVDLLGKPSSVKGEYSKHSIDCKKHFTSPEIPINNDTKIKDAIFRILEDDHICCRAFALDKRHQRLRFIYNSDEHNITSVSFNSEKKAYIVLSKKTNKNNYPNNIILTYAER